jgi:hypothetical protein
VKHYVLVGDSLTMQTANYFKVFAFPDRVSATYWPGTNPVAVRWIDWVRNAGPADVVVLQDEARVWADMGGYDVPKYRAAVAAIRDAAHAAGAKFVVLDGTHPRVEDLCDATFPMAPPDDPDGVHYLAAGAQREAKLLLDQLRGRFG